MKKQEIWIQSLQVNDMKENLLDNYSRYQEVNKVWRVENNEKVIKDISFIEEWDYNKKQEVIEELKDTLLDSGSVFGAYEGNGLKGFASLSGAFYGEDNEYLQLLQLHVSNDCRGKGIGKMLFHNCIEKARKLGARKLYISGHSSIETQSFYQRVGCVDAGWLYKRQVELEPYDCQLEYVL